MGWTQLEAAQRLLNAMREPWAERKVEGIYRETHDPYTDSQRIARQDTIPSAVRLSELEPLTTIDKDLQAHWQDDEEKPHEWASLDLRRGVAERRILAWLYEWESWLQPQIGRVWNVDVEWTELQFALAFVARALCHSEAELRERAFLWPNRNGSEFATHCKQDLRCERYTHSEIERVIWPDARNPERKRGRPRTAHP